MRIHTLAVVIVAALVLAAGASPVTLPRLTGTVGPSATISLKQGAKKVTSLKAGRYMFAIGDRSTFHNFHLTGPGVNKSTTVGGTGNKTWTLVLKRGTYRYVCDPHAANMKGSFRVT